MRSSRSACCSGCSTMPAQLTSSEAAGFGDLSGLCWTDLIWRSRRPFGRGHLREIPVSLIWQAMGDEQPDPTVGNRGNGWFGAQRGRVDGIKVVPNPDPVRGPPLIFNYNLLHGDAYPLPPAVAYSGARSLSTPPSRLWFSK